MIALFSTAQNSSAQASAQAMGDANCHYCEGPLPDNSGVCHDGAKGGYASCKYIVIDNKNDNDTDCP